MLICYRIPTVDRAGRMEEGTVLIQIRKRTLGTERTVMQDHIEIQVCSVDRSAWKKLMANDKSKGNEFIDFRAALEVYNGLLVTYITRGVWKVNFQWAS